MRQQTMTTDANARRGAGTPPSLLPVLLLAGLLAAGGCRDSAPDDVINQEETTEALVFVKTEAEETLNRSWAPGNLYKLSPISPDGVVTPITDFVGASISDPCVSFDGQRILFSMRPSGGGNRNIWEINADGTGLRQVTSGGGHDFDPLYLPDGNIMFTSSRHGGMDEYNHSPAEVLYTCRADGSDLQRVSFNMSDDFDPALMPDGRVIYTRWEHFGTFNRFPIFFCNPDGTLPFHEFGPHNRNFFHPQPTPDGRLIAIESTMVNEDAGPIAVLKIEAGPADPAGSDPDRHWNVLTPQVNTDGAPWSHGAFKYPFPLGGNTYVASYTLPAAEEQGVDYGLYTFTLHQEGAGTDASPATISIVDLTFLYNDPNTNEYDAQLLAPRDIPPVIPSRTNPALDYGTFLAHDVFNRSLVDGQEVPVRGQDAIDKIAVIAGLPTLQGEPNDFSANEFERRALMGYAPVQTDGSFHIKVPAGVPFTFATLDELDRGFVSKRTWLYAHRGTEDKCIGCHQDRDVGAEQMTNPYPLAATLEPTDLNVAPDQYTYVNYRDHIAPIVEANCASCHQLTFTQRDSLVMPDNVWITLTDTIPAPGDLDLTAVPDTTARMMQVFPRAYLNLSGESMTMEQQVVVPAFPRRSRLIDYVLGVGAAADQGPHPAGAPLTAQEQELFKIWVLLGAQYR
ncbi:MAG: PD40 domain-containing protein [Krumholzibacteria bacterium]|nr:PD40 domain-containing protein [Candidatus Krumholzibacteria bacterium]